MYQGTLFDELRGIEQSDFAHLDRGAEYVDVIGRRRSKNSLVEGAAAGRIYLPDEFDVLVKRVGGKRLYYPNKLSDIDSTELDEFNDVVGGIQGASLINNPAAVSGACAGVFWGACALAEVMNKHGEGKFSRRDFMKRAGKASIYIAGFTGFSFFSAAWDSREMNKKRKDVEYVQDKIEKYGRF